MKLVQLKTFLSRPELWCESVKLCHSTWDQKMAISVQDLPRVLKEIYPDLSLMEIFQWLRHFKENKVNIEALDLAQQFNFHWSNTYAELFNQIEDWPQSFFEWASLKKAHGNDLKALLLITKLSSDQKLIIYNLLSEYQNLNVSLSDGKKILELTIDVIGQSEAQIQNLVQDIKHSFLTYKSTDQSDNSFEPKSKLEVFPKISSEQILKRLTKLRYPIAHNKDGKKKNYIEKSQWPSVMKIKFLRQGDQSGFEGSFFISEPEKTEKVKKAMSETLDQIEKFYFNEKQ